MSSNEMSENGFNLVNLQRTCSGDKRCWN